MIQRNPEYSMQVDVQLAVQLFNAGQQVIAYFEDERGIYAAQVLDRSIPEMSELRDVPFHYMKDITYYVRKLTNEG